MGYQSPRTKKYERVSDGDSEEYGGASLPMNQQPNVNGKLLMYLAMAAGFVFAFMLGVLLMYSLAPVSSDCSTLTLEPTKPDKVEHHCGDTLEEAQANGCKFDYLSGLWLPEACSRSYEPEFLEMAGTGFYATAGADLDAGLGHNVTQLPFGTPYYTTRLHHVTHCLFLWLRNNDQRDGVPIAYNAMSLRHQSHCAQMILGMQGKGPKALWEVAVRGDIYRQSC